MSGKGLYMLAVMPPEQIAATIDKERRLFADTYGFVRALKPPVHVTLYEPFKWPENKEAVFSRLHGVTDRQQPFELRLLNYGFFEHPKGTPVIYIALENAPVLKGLQHRVRKEVDLIRKERSRLTSFHPHITIGYRDVTWEGFSAIKQVYSNKTFAATFMCHSIFLWKHTGTHWATHTEFRFNGQSDTEGTAEPDLFTGMLADKNA